MGSFSKQKYEHRILNESNSILRSKLNDPRFTFVSVTKVELNKDFSVAKIYWDTFDESKKDEINKAMGTLKGKFKSLLAKVLQVRSMPEILFYYDAQYVEEQKIMNLLNEAQASDNDE